MVPSLRVSARDRSTAAAQVVPGCTLAVTGLRSKAHPMDRLRPLHFDPTDPWRLTLRGYPAIALEASVPQLPDINYLEAPVTCDTMG